MEGLNKMEVNSKVVVEICLEVSEEFLVAFSEEEVTQSFFKNTLETFEHVP